jgi:hypothetical protein
MQIVPKELPEESELPGWLSLKSSASFLSCFKKVQKLQKRARFQKSYIRQRVGLSWSEL